MNMHVLIPGTTKRAQVARALLADIQRGRYVTDTLLPSENVLTAKFGVSRQTIRAALGTLHELGMTESVQGVGHYVRARSPSTRYMFTLDSATDLLQYASNTKATVLSITEIQLGAEQAGELGRKQGESWWQVATVRISNLDERPIASSLILIPYKYGSVLDGLKENRGPLFVLIQQEMHVSISEISQHISATTISDQDAHILEVAPHTAGLRIERRYFGRDNELFEVSRSIHPADVFSYSMRIRRSVNDPVLDV